MGAKIQASKEEFQGIYAATPSLEEVKCNSSPPESGAMFSDLLPKQVLPKSTTWKSWGK